MMQSLVNKYYSGSSIELLRLAPVGVVNYTLINASGKFPLELVMEALKIIQTTKFTFTELSVNALAKAGGLLGCEIILVVDQDENKIGISLREISECTMPWLLLEDAHDALTRIYLESHPEINKREYNANQRLYSIEFR